MKRMLLMVFVGSSLMAMQRETLKITQEKLSPTDIQERVKALEAMANLGKLPAEIAASILKKVALEEVPGQSSEEKLYNVVTRLRILMATCRSFYQFAGDYSFNANLIDELAKKYTDGFRLKAALFLSTPGAGHWLIENVIVVRRTISGSYLRNAAVIGDLWQVRFILKYFPQLINDRGRLNMTVLMWAALYGRTKVVDFLLNFPGIDADAVDANGTTALMYACMNHQSGVVAQLLEHGIDINGCTQKRERTSGESWAHCSINHARRQAVSNLQRFRWLPGHTALMFACELQDIATIRLLAQVAAINPNSGCNESWTPMGYANIAFNSNLGEQDGGPALLRACARGNLEIVNLLLSMRKINVNGQTLSGNNALMEAVYHGRLEVVKRLLQQRDIDVNSVAYWPHAIEEITAIKLARRSKSRHKDEIIKLLFEHGAIELPV